MPLPSSGEIHLNEIHIEAGGSSGSACAINDTDIRDLIGASSGSAMDFADWYGASAGPSIGGDWPDSDTNLTDSTTGGAQARAGFNFTNDGEYDRYQTVDSLNRDYLTEVGAGKGTGFYIKWVKNSGTTPNNVNMASQNTYYQLNTTRYIYLTSSGSFDSCNVTITIASSSGGADATAWTGSFNANSEP